VTEFAALAPLAEALRARHHGPEDLVLPNAWDAASAREVVDGGFPVVATTSSGVAKSLGWADGEETPLDEMFAAIARITRVVDVPVTADIEGGYGLSPEQLVARLLAAGAVGCNVEDADHGGDAVLHDANRQADYLAAMRAAARETGVSIVINARIDVFIREFGEPKDRVAETLRRAAIYREAGADCVFPIGISDEEEIRAVVTGAGLPVNVWVRQGVPSLARLRELGVARISFGGGLHRRALEDLRHRLTAIRTGDSP
jgi:2-methylisocitrate lyase-like PEP mutase family enzyme